MAIDSKTLHSKLKEFFGFDSFKGDQEQIISHLVAGNDAFVLMPTGGGKSLCYQLPALVMEGTAIVISPLIALMKNQVDAIRGFVSGNDGIAHFLNSSLSKAQINEVREDLLTGVTKLLYVAPESLTKPENIEMLKEIRISFYAVDEAHCISEWGHDFRPEYRRIRSIIEEIGTAPVIALTATATPKVQSDIQKNLGISGAKVFKSSFNRPNLYYEIRDKSDPKRDIIRFIRQNPGKSGIIYCLSRKKVEELSELLNINGIKALPYHAGLDARTRAENQDRFLMEEIDVIVATIAFGMGIDKPDVRFVIHYDIPKSLEGYYQETGRAGRDGGEGKCIAFYSYKDIQKLEKFMQGKPVSEQEIGKQLLLETVAYAESNQCRRKLLMNYFGEDYLQDNCGACDNCLHPKKQFDGQEEMALIIELIESMPEHFKMEHIANILAGVSNALIKSYEHDRLEFFGAGKDHSVRFWCDLIHQGIVRHFLEKDIESYGLIYVTDLGREFAAHPYRIMLTEERQFVDGEDDDDVAVVNPLGDVQGRNHGGAAAHSREDGLLRNDSAGHGYGFLAFHHLLDVYLRRVVNVRHDGFLHVFQPLDVVAADRMCADHLDIRIHDFQEFRQPHNGARGAEGAYQIVDFASCLLPDFQGGGLVVGEIVGGVLELVRHEIPVGFGGDFRSGQPYGPVSAFIAGSQCHRGSV